MNNPFHCKEPLIHARHLCLSTLWATLLAATLMLGVVSCKKEAAAKPADVDYYTCTMHPSVKKHDPNDKCPICSMDLVPVKKR